MVQKTKAMVLKIKKVLPSKKEQLHHLSKALPTPSEQGNVCNAQRLSKALPDNCNVGLSAKVLPDVTEIRPKTVKQQVFNILPHIVVGGMVSLSVAIYHD